MGQSKYLQRGKAMRKTIRAFVLIMALAVPAFAGDFPFGVSATGDIPNDVTAADEIPYGDALLNLLLILL
jgi:hypothetical protein